MLAPSPDRPPLTEETQFLLRVLGPFELSSVSDELAILIPSEKMRALLIYLAAAPGLVETRSRLATHLWSESNERHARQSLRQLLSNFRRSVAAEVLPILIFDDLTIGLARDIVTVDRDSLLNVPREADTEDLIRRADLYRGVFGAGLATHGEDDESWLVDEQNRTRDAAIMLLDRLVRRLAEEGRQIEALDYANRLFSLDQFCEETHRLVIVQRAAVYGRASAMTFFETVRLLLRQELMVAPEAATRQLIDSLRDAPAPRAMPTDIPIPGSLQTAQIAAPEAASEAQDTRLGSRRAGWRWWVTAAAMVMITAIGAGFAYPLFFTNDPQAVRYVGEAPGRTSVALMPFEVSVGDAPWRDRVPSLEAETRLAFQRVIRLSIVEPLGRSASLKAVEFGRASGARYVVVTRLNAIAGQAQADMSLVNSATGVAKALPPVLIDGQDIKFAREFQRTVFGAIAYDRARTLSTAEPDTISAWLWRAWEANGRIRRGAEDPEQQRLFEAVLAREPNQLLGLLGLIETFALRVSRARSAAPVADLERMGQLLSKARELAPNEPEIAYQEGMWHKLQGRFQQAEEAFKRTVRLDRAHWNAAAQVAHVKIFMGRFEEAYREMQAATAHLLPDVAASEIAGIAGETALVAGDPLRAVEYFDQALSVNPTVGPTLALRAAALWLAGREQEARAAGLKSIQSEPPYSPGRLAKRGGLTATVRYRDARDLNVAAYAAALAPEH